MQAKIKILVIGPQRCGKTTLANLISGHSDHPASIYHPTSGVRILQLQKEPPRANRRGGDNKVNLQIWDCSGDPRYEKCWSAFRKGTNGIIFVYDGEDPPSEMEHYARSFPQQINIPPSQCILFSHFKGNKPRGSSRPPRGLERVLLYQTSMENTSSIQTAFDKLFNTIYTTMIENEESAENKIMNAQQKTDKWAFILL